MRKPTGAIMAMGLMLLSGAGAAARPIQVYVMAGQSNTQELVGGPILIIKTAWGAKSLHGDFRPHGAGPGKDGDAGGGKYYRLMTEHVKRVLKDIERVCPAYDLRHGYEMAGFVWFQGVADMGAREYSDRGKPGGHGEHTTLLSHFIRDVRKEFNAPRMPFVIGVIGIDGVIDPGSMNRNQRVMHYFRQAMADMQKARSTR